MFNGIHFAGLTHSAQGLFLILLVAVCLAVKLYKSVYALKALSSVRLRSIVVHNGAWWRRILKYSLFFVGFIFLIIALFQPCWDMKESDVQQHGRDLLIAVDISRSMSCSDEKPNRLEFAKQKIKKILLNLKCERVGLILFSGEAVVQCPLTVDYGAFFMFLDNLDVETLSSGTTHITAAIRAALDIFKSVPLKKTKLLCIFTDGEDFSSDLSSIKQQAIEQKLSICTFGIGSSRGAPIPILDLNGKNRGFEKDDKGNIIMSKFNEGILKNVSQQTGGMYIHGAADHSDVKEFIAYVNTFEKESLGSVKYNKYQEQYPYFVAVSFLCFGLEWLL